MKRERVVAEIEDELRAHGEEVSAEIQTVEAVVASLRPYGSRVRARILVYVNELLAYTEARP